MTPTHVPEVTIECHGIILMGYRRRRGVLSRIAHAHLVHERHKPRVGAQDPVQLALGELLTARVAGQPFRRGKDEARGKNIRIVADLEVRPHGNDNGRLAVEANFTRLSEYVGVAELFQHPGKSHIGVLHFIHETASVALVFLRILEYSLNASM